VIVGQALLRLHGCRHLVKLIRDDFIPAQRTSDKREIEKAVTRGKSLVTLLVSILRFPPERFTMMRSVKCTDLSWIVRVMIDSMNHTNIT
jgi:hypothetical protein